MLPKVNRIKKKKDFEIIFKKGTTFKNNLFVLKVVKKNFGKSRFGFIVSSKISKKAIVRNKVRRRLEEIIKAEVANIMGSVDIILISLSGIEKKEFSETREALHNLLIGAEIIKKSPD